MVEKFVEQPGSVLLIENDPALVAFVSGALASANYAVTTVAGSVEVIARHDGSLYAGTTAGLFRLAPTRTAELASFEDLEGMDRAVWSLLSAGPSLLIGSSDGIFEWRAKQMRLVAGGRAIYDLKRSLRDPDV